MAPTILDSQPYLTAAMLQAFFYALYIVSLVHALRWLLYEEEGWTLKSRNKVNWLLLTISLSVFMFSTVDVVLEVLLQLTSSSPSLGISSKINYQLGIASIVMENTTLLIADAVLISRCWLVYQRSWRVIYFPLVLWLANVSLFVLWLTVYTISIMEGFAITLHDLVSLYALRSFYCCTFTTNLYATIAIVYRLRRVARDNSTRPSILYHICRTVAATGILYTFTALPLVVTVFFFPENMVPYLICDAVNFSMAGITFNLLLIRVGQLRAGIEMDTDGSERGLSTSVLFSTQLGIPTLATADLSVNSVSAHQRMQTAAKPEASMSANK